MIIVDSRRTATESGAYVRLIRLCTLDKTHSATFGGTGTEITAYDH